MTSEHVHLEGDQLDEVGRAFLDGTTTAPECAACAGVVEEHARYLSLARLVARDTREPEGMPAVESVRTLRRRTFGARAAREVASIFGARPPVRGS